MRFIAIFLMGWFVISCDSSSNGNNISNVPTSLEPSSVTLNSAQIKNSWSNNSEGLANQMISVNWAPAVVRITEISSTAIQVDWPEVEGANGYYLHAWRSDLGRGFTGIEPAGNPAVTVVTREVTLPATRRNYTFEGLNSDRPYIIEIAVVNALGEQSLSWLAPEVSTGGVVPSQTINMDNRSNTVMLHRSLFEDSSGLSKSNLIVQQPLVVPPATIMVPENAPDSFFIRVQEESETDRFSNQVLVKRFAANKVYKNNNVDTIRGVVVTSDPNHHVVITADNSLIALNNNLSNPVNRSIPADSDYQSKCQSILTGDNSCENYPVQFTYDVEQSSLYYCGSGLRRGIPESTPQANELGAIQCHIIPIEQFSNYDFSQIGFNNEQHVTLSQNESLPLGSLALKLTPSATNPGLYDEILTSGTQYGIYSNLTESRGTSRDISPFLFKSTINSDQDGQTLSNYLLQPRAVSSSGRGWIRHPSSAKQSFFHDDYVYNFYTQRNLIGNDEVIESRVSRHCINDTGPSDNADAHFFQSYYTAKLYCGLEVLPGENGYGNVDFRYNYITAITEPKNDLDRVFGVFNSNTTTQLNGDTAICLYSFYNPRPVGDRDLRQGLFDIFFEDILNSSITDPTANSEVQNSQPTCDPSDDDYIIRNQDQAENQYRIVHDVNQIGDNPIFLLPGEQSTDTKQKLDDPTRLLVSTKSGKLFDLKLTNASCLYGAACSPNSYSPGMYIYNEYQLTNNAIISIALDPIDKQRVYAISDEEVIMIELD
ncbi:fibronectin type III domain-containing protein [Pelagibaculum spongiae]|uniref:Fibronectin type-III domain-containing protein n=1 Tax=Pelagibaculum spongiae TaxID=2080658 RepID=A0A2V1GRY9_9GAMM|nr:fibronectin type III domain-containing protein [Pelagibaculum spongiae]PVZ68159.1 hypothetical protein DC094_12715 [Pelagibaculum spongiae]